MGSGSNTAILYHKAEENETREGGRRRNYCVPVLEKNGQNGRGNFFFCFCGNCQTGGGSQCHSAEVTRRLEKAGRRGGIFLVSGHRVSDCICFGQLGARSCFVPPPCPVAVPEASEGPPCPQALPAPRAAGAGRQQRARERRAAGTGGSSGSSFPGKGWGARQERALS